MKRHITIGPITIYPLNCAMHGAINIWTKSCGYVCFKPPTWAMGKWWSWYFYLSPNATPWAATLLWGKEHTRSERLQAKRRKVLWGHGYSMNEHNPLDLNYEAVDDKKD